MNAKIGKKGEGFTISQLVTIVLAVVLLVIIVITLYGKYVNGVWWWARYLPEPEIPCVDGPGCEGVSFEIVRYSLGSDNVQYYTGTEWRDFPEDGLLKFKDKITFRDKLESNLRDAYFSSERDRSLEIIELDRGTGLIEGIVKGPRIFNRIGLGGTDELRAYTNVEVRYKSDKPSDEYIVNYNGKMYKITVKSAQEGTKLQDFEEAGRAEVESKDLPGGEAILTLRFKSYIREGSTNFGERTKDYMKELSGKVLSIRKRMSGPPSVINIPKGKNDKYEFKLTYTGKEDRGIDGEFVYKLYANGADTKIEVRYDSYYHGVWSDWEDNLGNGYIYARSEAERVYKDTEGNADEKKIAKQVEIWRDSILRKPIRIEYVKKIEKNKNSEMFADYYCGNALSINEEKYVTVYLDKPTKDAECKIEGGK